MLVPAGQGRMAGMGRSGKSAPDALHVSKASRARMGQGPRPEPRRGVGRDVGEVVEPEGCQQ